METRPPIEPDIKVGVSSCLLGEMVRYDGDHRCDRWVTDTLGEVVTLVPVCPEVEVGMGVPRETVRLEGDSAAPRMIAPGSGADWTTRMNRYARRRVRELDGEDLCGYIFKKNSPSCGVFRVKVHDEHGRATRSSRGLFAAAFAERFPLVPVEDEGRLLDTGLRENFIERVFAFRRLRDVFGRHWKRGELITFHSREESLLMDHSPKHHKVLGRLVKAIADHTPAVFRDRYMELFMEALAKNPAGRRRSKIRPV